MWHLGLRVRPPTILHPGVVISCFSSQGFAKQLPVGLYYSTLAYENIEHDRQGKLYGVGIMAVDPRDFQIWGVQLHHMLNSPTGQQHMVLLVSAKLDFIRLINDPRSVDGEASSPVSAAGEKSLLALFLMKRRHPGLELPMGGTKHILLNQNVILQPGKTCSWTMIPLTYF